MPHDTRYSVEELDSIYRVYRINRVTGMVTSLGRYAASTGIAVVLAWCVVEVARALAGQQTNADLAAVLSFALDAEGLGKILGRRGIFEGLLILATISSVGYARMCKRRAQDTIEQFAPFRVFYEEHFDPGRTSSGLMPRGDTPPGEKL